MVGARNNGMTAVGVLYGYGSEAELLAAGAHRICATPQALRDHAVTRLFNLTLLATASAVGRIHFG